MSNSSLKQRSLILLLSVAVASQADASSLTSIGHLAAGGGPPGDGSCGNSFAGNGKGLRCPNNGCCSQWGWCGSKAEHCAVGCQSVFGVSSSHALVHVGALNGSIEMRRFSLKRALLNAPSWTVSRKRGAHAWSWRLQVERSSQRNAQTQGGKEV